mgnify:CR=1 FL=1
MTSGFFITGTDTDVGKTVVTAILGLLFQKKGKKVGVMKPVATGGKKVGNTFVSQDARFLKDILSLTTPLEIINPLCLEHPLAPKLAAEHIGKEIDLLPIRTAYTKIKDTSDLLLVEGVGGVMVPIRHDYLVADLFVN